MGTCSKDKAPNVESLDGFEGHYADLDGYTVGWETFTDEMDPAALFVGLPGDRCQSPHWGIVTAGTLTFRYEDGTEDIATAGHAYYARPGHLPHLAAGTSVIEFSPTEELAKTLEVVLRNAAAMQGGGA